LNLQKIAALKWAVSAYIALAGLYVIGNLAAPLGTWTNRIFLSPSVNQSLFWCWFGALGFSQAVFNRRLQPALRIVVGVLVLGAVYVTWMMKRDWISGWLPLLLAVGLCLVVARPKMAVPGGLALLALILLNSQQAAGLVMGGDNAYSLMTRVEAWRTLAGILAANPLFGLGPSNYYWYTQLFPILGYNVTFNSHNNYVDLIAQVGVVGLGFYLWLLWQTGRDVLKAVPLAGDGFERAFLIGCFGGLGATAAAGLLGDWALPFVYNIGMAGFRVSALAWLFMGAAVAVSLRLRGEAREAENQAVLSAAQAETDR
ncbi:MAG TPA: O-antigen ligase family protein, partial [Anaerolineaceae bacterium]